MRFWPKRFYPELFFERLRASQPGTGYGKAAAAHDLRALFLGSDLGRRCLWVLLEWCGTHRQSFDPLNQHVTDFKEGRRSIGLWLVRLLYDQIEEGDEDNGRRNQE